MLTIETVQTLLTRDNFRSEAIRVKPLKTPQTEFTESLIERITNNDPTLNYLNLSNQNIDDNQIQSLVSILKDNNTITTLVLYGNNISVDGAAALSELLSVNKTISTLDLNYNQIKAEGASKLTEVLKMNSTLTTLYLAGNGLGSVGTAAFAELFTNSSKINTINLQNNKLKDSDLRALTKGMIQCPNLKSVNLSHNYFKLEGARFLAEFLKQKTTLQKLSLNGCFFINNGVIKIVVDELKNQKHLECLSLNTNMITIKELAGVIDLLKQNCSLKELNLSGNYIGDTETMALAQALKYNSTLKFLCLGANQISDGEGIVALADSLAKHSSINHIILSGNNIGSKGGVALVKMIAQNPHIITLDVSGNFLNVWTGQSDPKIHSTVDELINNNLQHLKLSAKHLIDRFYAPMSSQSKLERSDREVLKYYQACDHELLCAEMGDNNYKQIAGNITRYTAINFLDLIHCKGNGKSTIEQLSPQLHYRIFSYLELDKTLWLNQLSKCNKVGHVTSDKIKQSGNNCNLW